MQYQVYIDKKTIKARISLPASKSISNRVMIINALSYNSYPVRNLSDCDDTRVMEQVLNSNESYFDIGHAGTAMRFLTAYLSKIAGRWEITGSERMQQRPIGILVEALRQLGAKIEFTGKSGYPPLRIFGSHLKGKELELDGSVSSQYITALLLIAPTLENGLILNLKNKITSSSYINLTLQLMSKFGIRYRWEGNKIEIPEQSYFPMDYMVEADWSGASYWFQIAAMSESAEIILENLLLPSIQGDAVIARWFEQFGVFASQMKGGLKIVRDSDLLPERLDLNLEENPDVAQTLAVLCVARKIPFRFSGLETLKIKETDRIKALQNELIKFGAQLHEPYHGKLEWDGTFIQDLIQDNPLIATYHDHRMAMAFAPLALTGKSLTIEDPGVVTKSYPDFWKDLEIAGFILSA